MVDFGLPPSLIFCNSRWKVLKMVTMFLFVITLRTSVSTAFKIKLSLFFMHEFLSKTQGPVENKSPKEMFLCWFIYRIVYKLYPFVTDDTVSEMEALCSHSVGITNPFVFWLTPSINQEENIP